VSHLLLAGTIWVLDAMHERSAAQLAAAIEMLLNREQLWIQDAEVVAQALARKASHLPLGTFDRGLAKLEGAQRL